MVLEDPGGVLLATRLADSPMPLAALALGRSLASTLGALHSGRRPQARQQMATSCAWSPIV